MLTQRRIVPFAQLATGLAVWLGMSSFAGAASRPGFLPLLAQEATESTGPSILDWGIVVVLIAAAVFAVCRTSRRV